MPSPIYDSAPLYHVFCMDYKKKANSVPYQQKHIQSRSQSLKQKSERVCIRFLRGSAIYFRLTFSSHWLTGTFSFY